MMAEGLSSRRDLKWETCSCVSEAKRESRCIFGYLVGC